MSKYKISDLRVLKWLIYVLLVLCGTALGVIIIEFTPVNLLQVLMLAITMVAFNGAIYFVLRWGKDLTSED